MGEASGLGHAAYQEETGGGVTAEEYQIYSQILTQMYTGPKAKQLVIWERNFKYDFARPPEEEPWKEKPKKNIQIDPAAVSDFEAKNSRQWLFDADSFKVPVKVRLVSDDDMRATFHAQWGDREWNQYYLRFPQSAGFEMLSRIGFNADHTQALMYIGSRCGPDCGDIHFLLLKKVNGAWTIERELKKQTWG